jgi:hypothetical protein
MLMSVLVALDAKSDEIFSRVIAEVAPRLNVMDLKIFRLSADLATPAVSLQNVMAELSIVFRIQHQARSFRADASQSVTWTSSSNCFLCGFGRPMISRVREGNRASWLPVSKLTPARKSAEIISRQ